MLTEPLKTLHKSTRRDAPSQKLFLSASCNRLKFQDTRRADSAFHNHLLPESRHAARLTMNVYVKSVAESQVNAMDALSAKLETCKNLATGGKALVN